MRLLRSFLIGSIGLCPLPLFAQFGPERAIDTTEVHQPYALAFADLDGDGRDDVVGAGDRLLWAANTRGSFGEARAIDADLSGEPDVACGDLDGDGDADSDGDPDLLYATFGRILWRRNTGNMSTRVAAMASDRPRSRPDPFVTEAWLTTSYVLTQQHAIELFDVNGRLQRRLQGTGAKEVLIERGDLPAGLYLVRITAPDGGSQQVRVVAG